jgi:hypothetical protein
MTDEELEEWLETTIDDSFDLGWTSLDAAKLIVSRMQAEGLVLIEREGMRERVASALRHVSAKISVGSDGETDPDVMWFSHKYADAAIAAMLGGEHAE